MMEQFLKDRRIGVSVSQSGNLAELGLVPDHVEDDLVEVTRYLVAAGATVIYGGDLRVGGFTGLLLEVVARHQSRGDTAIRFENFLAWPLHATIPFKELAVISDQFKPVGKLVLLAENGSVLSLEERSEFDKLDVVSENVWAPALTAMRNALAEHCDARIVAGGRTHNFKGSMPGIAEETLLSLKAGKPTFVTGALGGCALDIGLRCGLATSPLTLKADWPGLDQFANVSELNPGLETKEASALASTILGTEMLVLLLKGLKASLQARAPAFYAQGPAIGFA